MKKIKYYLNILIIVIYIITLISCDSSIKKGTQTYAVIDSLELTIPISISKFTKTESGFIAYDRYENSLNLISDKGDFIDTYIEHGKGPGEILKALKFSTFEDRLFLADMHNRKILKFRIIENKIIYEDEFRTGYYTIDTAIINNKLLISTIHSQSKFILYNQNGSIVKEYPDLHKQIPDCKLDEWIRSVCFLNALDNTICVSQSGDNIHNIHFFSITFENEITYIKTIKVPSCLKIHSIEKLNDYFYITFVEAIDKNDKIYITVYDKNAEFVKTININPKDYAIVKSGIFTFISNGLWCANSERNDKVLYLLR